MKPSYLSYLLIPMLNSSELGHPLDPLDFTCPCSQLKMLAPNHPIVARCGSGEDLFERAAAALA